MSKVFLADIDGVVLHWGPGFSQYVKHELGWKPEGDIEQFYYVEDWLGITREDADVLISDFHHSDYFKHLPPFIDAPYYLPKFKEAGWEFIAITAVGRTDTIHSNRKHNLDVHFPDTFTKIITVDPSETKVAELAKFDSCYWVDDARKHAIAGHEAGHKTFFMNREHDPRQKIDPAEHPEIEIVDTWEGIYNWFVENEKI